MVVEVISSPNGSQTVPRKKKIFPGRNQRDTTTPTNIGNMWMVEGPNTRSANSYAPLSNVIKKTARIVFPSITAIFMVAYWISAVVKSNNA